MKLNRIYLLNSAGYTKADMLLDASSIQIAYGNNIVHEEYTSVESRGHYFPTQNTSYIVFECFSWYSVFN